MGSFILACLHNKSTKNEKFRTEKAEAIRQKVNKQRKADDALWLKQRCGEVNYYLAGCHGVLVGALPALLGVHGDASAPKVVVEEGVVLPWEAVVIVLKLVLGLAAADPHCFAATPSPRGEERRGEARAPLEWMNGWSSTGHLRV